MERSEFIKYGTVITASAFITKYSFAGNFMNTFNGMLLEDNRLKRPDFAAFSEPILKAIALGIHAPSPHNTQSWKFKVINDLEMELYVNEHILLPATDPPSRQIHLGAGCFIETMVLGANRLGYNAAVSYFPLGYAGEQDFGKKPVASIKLSKTDVAFDQLANYIETRQTNRRKYTGKLLSMDEFEALKTMSGTSYSKLVFKNSDLKPYLDIFYKGFEIESRTFETNEETRNIFRFSEEERANKRDGISIPQMGYKGMIANIAEKSLDSGNKDKWHSDKSIGLSLKNVKKGIKSSKGLVFWYTETNEFLDWVKAGRDYVRFSLALTKQGLYAHPYNQAIQEYDEMKAVRDELNERLGIKSPQKIQMIVRIGRSSTPYYSYRKQLNDYLTK